LGAKVVILGLMVGVWLVGLDGDLDGELDGFKDGWRVVGSSVG
jgi:hypothetical protein